MKKQWIRIANQIELLDTPGVLWPKFESQEVGLKLSFTGTIKDEILDKEEIAFYLVQYLLTNYANNLIEKYQLNEEELRNIVSEKDENEAILEIIEVIGKKRGCLVSRTEKLIEKKFPIFY